MASKVFETYKWMNTENLKSHLMGTIWEKSSRKRKICRYQRPAKCCRPTMTSDTTTRAPNRILVKQLTSKSNKPTYHEQQGQTLVHYHFCKHKCSSEVKQTFQAVPSCFSFKASFIQRWAKNPSNVKSIKCLQRPGGLSLKCSFLIFASNSLLYLQIRTLHKTNHTTAKNTKSFLPFYH